MIIYIITIMLSLFFTFFAIKNKNNKKIYIIFSILSSMPLFFISAFRYDVGTDYIFRYVSDFNTILAGSDVGNLEFLFKLLIKICILFTDSYFPLFIITSAMIIFPVYYIIYKKSKYPLLSILLFMLGTFFFNSLNLVRQYIAIVIILCSCSFIIEKKYLKWFLCVLLACMFHKSAAVGFCLIFLTKIKLYNPIFVLGLSLILFLYGDCFKEFIVYIISLSPYEHYINGIYSHSIIKESLLLFNIFVYLFMYVLYQFKKIRKTDDVSDKLFLNIQSLTLLICFVSIQFSLLYRIVEYFNIFQILAIPNFLDLKDQFNKFILFMILILFSFNFYYLNVKGNVNEILPYKFIFNKNLEFN